MSDLVLDCSVTMSWCFEDEVDSGSGSGVDVLLRHEAFVPWIWTLEVANVLLVAERRGRLASADSSRFLALLRGLPIRVDSGSVDRVWTDVLSLARQHQLSSYDAAYLELAARQGVPLLTLDQDLQRVAAEIGLPTAVE